VTTTKLLSPFAIKKKKKKRFVAITFFFFLLQQNKEKKAERRLTLKLGNVSRVGDPLSLWLW
jgi:hypothetical protein